jgi:hypothetical protein
MAKKPQTDVIALEREKYETKVKEFQDYLAQNPLITVVTADGEIKESKDSQEMRHKELLLQAKIMDFLPNWLLAIKTLRQQDEEKQERLRAGTEINDVAKLIMRKDDE